jgi:hypothetical protein
MSSSSSAKTREEVLNSVIERHKASTDELKRLCDELDETERASKLVEERLHNAMKAAPRYQLAFEEACAIGKKLRTEDEERKKNPIKIPRGVLVKPPPCFGDAIAVIPPVIYDKGALEEMKHAYECVLRDETYQLSDSDRRKVENIVLFLNNIFRILDDKYSYCQVGELRVARREAEIVFWGRNAEERAIVTAVLSAAIRVRLSSLYQISIARLSTINSRLSSGIASVISSLNMTHELPMGIQSELAEHRSKAVTSLKAYAAALRACHDSKSTSTVTDQDDPSEEWDNYYT